MNAISAVLLLTIAHVALAIVGYLDYQIWSQVEYLSQIPFEEFNSSAALLHAPRLFVVMPSYLLAERLSVETNAIYSLYVVLLASATAWVWIIIQKIVVVKSRNRNFIWVFPFILLHFINGRFAFALFGLSLLLLSIILIKLKRLRFGLALPLLSTGMLYSSVSSGVFSVAFMLLFLELYRERKNFLMSESFFQYLLRSTFIFLFTSSLFYFLFFFMLKNLDFYGGGFEGLFGMISHGFGLVLNPEPILENCSSSMNTACTISIILMSSNFAQATAIFMVSALVFVLSVLVYTSAFNPMAKRILAISALGGIFGFTTLMCFLVSLPILVRKKFVNAPLRI